MDGFLALNKPLGLTSHDCVAKVRRSLRQKRVGHAGTLDPAATGVLAIAVGRATRLLQFLPGDKIYRATIRLGQTTTTDDLEGELLAQTSAAHLSRATVTAALQAFVGQLQQIPPNFSAVQIQGQRLYHLARQGAAIAAPPRPVVVHRIDMLAWRTGETPELDVEIHCGAGTYIRAIARDLGQALQVGGTLAALARTVSSGFTLAECCTLEELADPHHSLTLLPADQGLQHLTALALPADLARRWCLGQKVSSCELDCPAAIAHSDPYRVLDAQGRFLGIGQWRTKDDMTILKQQVVYEPN